jgi:hypothetical protein
MSIASKALILPRLARLGAGLLLGFSCACMLLGIAWWLRPGAPAAHAAPCPYSLFTPNAGYVGLHVTVSGALSCDYASIGQQATFYIVPGDRIGL